MNTYVLNKYKGCPLSTTLVLLGLESPGWSFQVSGISSCLPPYLRVGSREGPTCNKADTVSNRERVTHSFGECYRIKRILHGKILRLILTSHHVKQSFSGEDPNVKGKIMKFLERTIGEDHHGPRQAQIS